MSGSLFDLFRRGGLVMWPLLACSITALAIGVERLLSLARINSDSAQLFQQVSQAIRDRRPAEARRLCEETSSPLARLLGAGLRRHDRPRTEIREALEQAGALEFPALERHLPILGTVAHLAPLLGLLGTVTGLVRCFQTIQEKASALYPVQPGDLAGGIWEALLTTVFGLGVAIPAYALYNYLVYRVNRLVTQMEVWAGGLADLLSDEAAGEAP